MDDTKTTLTPTTPLWSAARQLLAQYGKEFFKRWNKAAVGFDAEDIHDLRVASRRLREGLALFETAFPPKAFAGSRKMVKQVTGVLGDLRNTDEAILFFSQLLPAELKGSASEVQTLLDQLQGEAVAARGKLEKDLHALNPGPLKKRLKAETDRPQLFGNDRTDPLQSFSGFADRAIQERAGTVSELLPQARDEADAASQHRLRIAVKRLRYRLEILQPLLGPNFEELHAALKGYQEVLGKLHDLDVFSALVQERVPAGAGQQNLLRVITKRRRRLFSDFSGMLAKEPVDVLGAKARSYL